jgi:Zn finger protein HypA/HybF involved in hydrogenase expression
MGVKEYKMPNGKIAAFEYDESGVGKVTLECMDELMAMVSDRPQGEWIVYEGGWKDLDYYPPKCKCNQCGYEEDLYILNAKPTNFCPNCGADMRGEQE